MIKNYLLLVTITLLIYTTSSIANTTEDNAIITADFFETSEDNTESTEQLKIKVENETIETLSAFVKQKNTLLHDITLLKQKISKTKLASEKVDLNLDLKKIKIELEKTRKHLREIAAGIDISNLSEEKKEAFDFTKELLSLMKPIVDEVKEMTSDMRLKSSLKEKINYFDLRIPTLNSALENISLLQDKIKDKDTTLALNATKEIWEKQRSLMISEKQAAELQLNKIIIAENLAKASASSWVKTFFQKRGLYLSEAILVIILIIILSKSSYSAMHKYLPGFKAKHRCFRIRLLELLHRVFTILLLIIGPMIVFYLGEDWVLFSLGLLLLIGIGWTLRQALPLYWNQIYLFLNMGAVREGERIELQGLPWKIQKINLYCTLVNPMTDLTIRIPIKDLVDKISRPYEKDEPWFPCKKNDWVLLSDGIRGMVSGISQEMVQLIQRGGARKTYLMNDFLANSPKNLSISFRLKETIGINYNLQEHSPHKIPDTLLEFIQQKAVEDGYGDDLLSLKVEFEYANTSSLDIVVIADFNGNVADLYNRLRRRIQRWCVEACTEHQWEIPYPQMTLHKPNP